jgi:hypothetical protein
VRKNLEEGRKRIQDSLKTLSSQTPQWSRNDLISVKYKNN